jgi:putative PIN family toxin of toxin-antitoxin system
MIRAVLDTNVLVSALINPRGTPAQILDLWRGDRFLVLTSEAMMAELEDVLARMRRKRKYRLTNSEVGKLLRMLRQFMISVAADAKEPVVRDPDDAKLLTCAASGRADYVVTGDADLLSLKEHEGVAIVTPAEFLQVISNR